MQSDTKHELTEGSLENGLRLLLNDLRSPLSTCIQATKLLQATHIPEEGKQEILAILSKSVKDLADLLGESFCEVLIPRVKSMTGNNGNA